MSNKPRIMKINNEPAWDRALWSLRTGSLRDEVIDQDAGISLSQRDWFTDRPGYDWAIYLHQVSNAGLRGRTAYGVTIRGTDKRDFKELLKSHGYSLESLFWSYVAPEMLSNHNGIRYGSLTIYTESKKAINVYCQVFSRQNIKPLKTAPKKWRVSDVIRTMIHDQHTDLVTDMHTTDDYAHDNAVDCRRNQPYDPLKLAADLITSPSGWWIGECASNHPHKISVNCHHFLYLSFTPKLPG